MEYEVCITAKGYTEKLTIKGVTYEIKDTDACWSDILPPQYAHIAEALDEGGFFGFGTENTLCKRA